ncbi:MAG TPA: putative Ig domain-containing protein [Candidatus Limnocylindria bacterium]|nr:putative Ig domain-containing protein [Candidatus Limnocylindria bacterium]
MDLTWYGEVHTADGRSENYPLTATRNDGRMIIEYDAVARTLALQVQEGLILKTIVRIPIQNITANTNAVVGALLAAGTIRVKQKDTLSGLTILTTEIYNNHIEVSFDNFSAKTIGGVSPSIAGNQQPLPQTVIVGQSANFTVLANGTPVPGYKWQRKPNGSSDWGDLDNDSHYSGVTTATLSVNGADLIMSGDQFRCIASNGVSPNAVSNPATLTVLPPPPPAITSGSVASGVVGQLFNYQITASNGPKGYGATGLPASLSIDTNTGTITGTPTVSGAFTVTLSAGNSGGTGTATLTLTVTPAPTPINFLWAGSAGSTANDQHFVNSVCADASGNVYVAGQFRGTATIGGTTLTSRGDYDVLIAKLDANGNYLWVRQAGGTSGEGASAICVDGTGNVYVVGDFIGTASFGSTTLTSRGDVDAFVTKLDANGNFLWARQMGGTSEDHGNAVGVDGSGKVYVTGEFLGTATFGTFSRTAVVYGAFVAKLDASGIFAWVSQMGATDELTAGVVIPYALSVTSTGSVHVGGDLVGFSMDTVNFGGTTFTLQGDQDELHQDAFVAKLDTNGGFVWAKQGKASASKHAHINGIMTDTGGNVYMGGAFDGTLSFGTATLTSTGSLDGYVAKLDPSGVPVWLKQVGGAADGGVDALSLDGAGSVFAAGSFNGAANWSSVSLTSRGADDVFLAKLDAASGNYLLVRQGGGTGDDGSNSLGIDSSGNLYLAGYFSGSASFGNTTLTSQGSYDAFVAKLGVPPALFFTTQPVDRTVNAGESASFSAQASGTVSPTYQWQVRSNGGSAWSNLVNDSHYNGVTTTTLTVSGASPTMSGYQFQCLANNGLSPTAISSAALLTVNQPAIAPGISAHTGDQTIMAGATASFSVTATGTAPLTYRWQRQLATGGAFADLSDNVALGISGATTDTLQFANTPQSFSGFHLHCVVSNAAGVVTSDPALLTVNPLVAPSVTDPISQTITVGAPAAFSVAATGTAPLAYRWQRQLPSGGEFADVSDNPALGVSGVTSDTLRFVNTPQTFNGYRLRCIVTNVAGSATSNPATLTVNSTVTPPRLEARRFNDFGGFLLKGTAGLAYQIEYTDGLTPPQWKSAGTFTLSVSDQPWVDSTSFGKSARYYRVSLP